MPARVVMPKLGLSMKTGTISSWRVADGASVETGQTLFVVETEKVNMEIEATASGLVKHAEAAGATVPPGHLIGYIMAAGEAVPEIAVAASVEPVATAKSAAVSPAAAASGAAPGGRVAATPVARKLAEQLGVDLATLAGTGPGGRIVREDVEAAAAAPAPPAETLGEDAVPTRRALSAMRTAIASRMTASLRDTAQLSIGTDVDITELAGLLAALGANADEPAPTITDVLVLATARALGKHPNINVSLDGDEIVQHSEVHLGLAVALTDGLVVPVLRSVQRMNLTEIATARRAMAAAAREGKLTMDDLSGSTFTITSLGQNQVSWFTPIINPPESAILGVGRAGERVLWRDGSAVPRTVLPLSLTIDHRTIDGAPAAAFLDELVASLCEPLRLLT